MKKIKLFATIFALGLLPSKGVFGHAAEGKLSSTDICVSFEGVKKKNCQALFDGKQVPNKDALSYTLKFLALNLNKLKDGSCVKHGHGIAKQGIRNECQFVINDVNSRYQGKPFQSNGYLINLCAKDSRQLVRHFYLNKGTGTAKHGYSDREGAHTTSLGAYLTDSQIESFHPYKMKPGYSAIKRQYGRIPRLALVGLHSSNNDTSASKPMHASPFSSSWGCPSVSPANIDVLKVLAEGGPSLVMNYSDPKANPESSLTKCDAVAERVPAARPQKFTRRLHHGRTRFHYGRSRHSHRHIYHHNGHRGAAR